MSDDVVFLADAHLGAESGEKEAARTARLHRFLESLPGRIRSLVIVGDLFDFWFEYRTAIPRQHFATLAALRRLRDAGVEITYLNGNHDFWLGPFLSQEIGAITRTGPLTLQQQGRKLWIHHGDGLIGGDLGYRFLRRVLRSPFSIRLYQLIHPDLGIPLAHWISGRSREARDPDRFPIERLWTEVALPRFAEGFDGVIIGHFHRAFERREPGRELFVLGDWIDQFTYVVLRNGVLSLETWPTP
jgi:UDP-2,3-diacylglucosamine hydrolase